MKTLIFYSSHDGQTKKISEFLTALLDGEVIVDALREDYDIETFDRVIIGASIRYGHFSKTLDRFVVRNLARLEQKRAVFFCVNLTARKEGKDNPETNVYVRKFLQRTKWQPKLAAVFAGALLYPRYKWFDRVMIQFIMKITGGETDISKEVEYTNWEKVKQFAQRINALEK
ncbi:menaquinone-dependent protoporphyrinogen IX dehydrogenase [Rodentibacter pneumotropicus]|uniref:menaquinone-dependent protoporphyrinogen IX dehydrogenase n=1 Tax=Rodentibacter pneumotropicus TaxID=758 RepID=UPI0009861717|nr:menaquinone-dependent protoporphyrinogen IX dehydrogenase [Rodentibacter pneumotropicus]OOF61895.1 protoporphyrinogen oxidase [Rodentibacter pneumotropicus]THA18125.1 menaquinone-dependent protoporphyrinogen IX dehydrogenase [Rodentibacter pneumotropicus]